MREKMIDTYSDEYRKQCEARHVLSYPKEQRVAYYEAVKAIRGQKSLDELIAEVKRQHQLQQERNGVSL
jgi:hypothetical protein